MAALLLVSVLAGCGSEVFSKHVVPQSPDIATAPWPKLVDTPSAPPVGSYGPGVPNPAIGAQTIAELSSKAKAAEARAQALASPVVSQTDLARMGKGS